MDYQSIVLLAGVVLLFSFKGVILSLIFKFKTIKPIHAKELLKNENTLLVDVRTPEEYRAGHLPGSISMPLSTLQAPFGSLSKNGSILVICQSGTRSLIAASKLARAGFSKTHSVNGGLIRWS